MAIRNISSEDALRERIDALSDGRKAFALKALVLAGHVSENTMNQALGLAETIREDA